MRAGSRQKRPCRVKDHRSGDQQAQPAKQAVGRRVDAVKHTEIQHAGIHHGRIAPNPATVRRFKAARDSDP